ncbi:MAG: hypothetical protein AAGH15_27295 [Myxococcota bacterium]
MDPGRALRAALLAVALFACGGGEPSEPPACDRLDPVPAATEGSCARDGDCPALCGAGPTPGDDAPVSLACRPGSDDAGAACEGPGDCARGLCVVAGRCVAPCLDRAECAADERCRSVTLRREGGGTLRGRACVPELVLPPGLAASRGDVGGAEVALGAEPFQLLLTECAEESPALALGVPGRPPLFEAGVSGPASPLDATLDRGLALLLPSGDPVATEGAVLTFASELPRRQVGLPLGEVDGLALDLHYVGLGDLAPMGERGPPEVAAALDEVEALLGLRITRVGQHLVDGAAGDRLAILDFEPGVGFPEMPELARLGAGARRPGVPVFLVRLLEPSFLGLTGGIPGPLGAPGAEAAWVVISTELAGDDLGRVLAHELGHYLGLFHLVERDGFLREALGDTPQCPASADADGNGLEPDECAERGGDNLMFPLLADTLATPAITPSQASVLRRTASLNGDFR